MWAKGHIEDTQWGHSLFTEDGELVASCDTAHHEDKAQWARLCADLEIGPYYPGQVNPLTAPARFLPEEVALFEKGRCSWQTAYGMPWTEYCEAPSKPWADFGYCEYHSKLENQL